MTVTIAQTKPAATACDALVVLATPGRGKSVDLRGAGLTSAQANRVVEAALALGASGKAGEVTLIPAPSGIAAKKIAVVGLGDQRKAPDLEAVRRAVGGAIRSLAGSRKVAVAVSADADEVGAVALGAVLGRYDFTEFRAKSVKGRAKSVSAIVLLVDAVTPALKSAVAEAEAVATAVNLARDLVNTPANALPPAVLAERAEHAVAGLPVEVTIWDEAALAEEGCGGILAVGQGSANPPRLVKLVYAPQGATAHLALVGKGITFDTGGISIKPAADMDQMKGDMGGAAAVIGAVKAIAALELPIAVTGWVPSAENMPSGEAQRPGDVLTTFDGTTVEVLNTDAEGRLILADALGLAVQTKPDLIVDVATLTGAQRVALGTRIAGVMGNNDDARAQVCAAADAAGEQMWPMPLPQEMRASYDSAVADIANIGDRMGGMLGAGVFLSEFVPASQRWVHIDIAGPSFNDRTPWGYTPKGGTGVAVRTFVEMARRMAQDAAAG